MKPVTSVSLELVANVWLPGCEFHEGQDIESTNRPDIRLQPNLNAFDQLLVSSAWLREESIYTLLGIGPLEPV